MPSRETMDYCPHCNAKNKLTAQFCNQCGKKLSSERLLRHKRQGGSLYIDIAHPVTRRFRDKVNEGVAAAYYRELELAQQPGYVSSFDEF